MTAAVVLMAYGSPDRLEDVPAYYADIRGGRPIAPALLADLVARYDHGELPLADLAVILGASQHAVRRSLHELKVDTSNGAARRRQATHRWEKARGYSPAPPTGTRSGCTARGTASTTSPPTWGAAPEPRSRSWPARASRRARSGTARSSATPAAGSSTRGRSPRSSSRCGWRGA